MKKLLVILLAGLLLFSINGMAVEDLNPGSVITEEERFAAHVWYSDTMIEKYKDTNPELAAYHARWRDVVIPDPFPAEWRDYYGNFKDFVTLEMINEAFEGSVWQAYMMDEPVNELGQVPMEVFYVQDSEGKFSVEVLFAVAGKEDEYISHKDVLIEDMKEIP